MCWMEDLKRPSRGEESACVLCDSPTRNITTSLQLHAHPSLHIICIHSFVIFFPSRLVVLRIESRTGELGALSDDLLNGIQEVSFRGDLSSSSNRKHTGLVVSTILRRPRRTQRLTSVATDFSSAPVAFGHRRAIKSYRISLSTDILHMSKTSRSIGKQLTSCRGSSRCVFGPRCPVS